jgi:hypothetical protein
MPQAVKKSPSPVPSCCPPSPLLLLLPNAAITDIAGATVATWLKQ